MNINSIKGLSNIYKANKKNPVKKTGQVIKGDKVSISAEALKSAEVDRLKDVVKSTPDVRMDLVNELKAKINDPDYFNNDSVLHKLSTKVAESLGLK